MVLLPGFPPPPRDEIERLRDMLVQSFPIANRPDRLVPKHYYEAAFIESILRGRSWDAVDYQAVASLGEEILLLTPKAFCYYLPALAFAAMDEISDSRPVIVSQMLVFSLSLDRSAERRFLERAECLNVEQKLTVRTLLEMLNRYGRVAVFDKADRALCDYWRQATQLNPAPEQQLLALAVRESFSLDCGSHATRPVSEVGPWYKALVGRLPPDGSGIHRLSAASFRHELPTYLLASIFFEDFPLIPYEVVRALTPASEDGRPALEQRLATLRPPEVRAVASVLRFLSAYDPKGVGFETDGALSYWDAAVTNRSEAALEAG
jgi:hypothetical protein